MAVAVARSGSSAFADDLTDAPSFSSVLIDNIGDYIYAAWLYRSNESAELGIPTWNGESFAEIADLVIGDAGNARLQVFRLKTASSGTFDIVASNSQYKIHAGGYAVCTGVRVTTPSGTVVTESYFEWTDGAPSLSVSDGASGAD